MQKDKIITTVQKNKYLVTAITCAAIIGLSLIIVQVSKQGSIERQVQLKIEAEENVRKAEAVEKLRRKLDLQSCTAEAEEEYWSYMELNGTKNDDGSITAQGRFWDRAESDKQNDLDNCYKMYN